MTKLNTKMENNSQKSVKPPVAAPQRRPNEQGTINVSGFVKIYDPKTKQVFVETRE